ncbi:hypothetical protein [Sinorhizobium meliloti]|uniref:hypothetical protein n=1 Tax=Rhizobium meliloti TaxID=382 RepID=UPI001295CD72|nr:hypothetical protein [Sinorhizobium meliloti]MCO5965489.1 hypothetical protein [Sinorhizobium meliloti]MQW59649.1 hypothetical protein [Sinorhizobium meliloti]
MPRRKQFKGICRDILDSFVSRYNDLDGYWALGQYATFLTETGQRELRLQLQRGTTLPECSKFGASATYYRGAVLRLMDANEMPYGWFADACIRFSMVCPTKALCEVEIVSDLGKTYRCKRKIDVQPHNPLREHRRRGNFGPSNQVGQ